MIQPIGYFRIHRELYNKPIWKNSTAEQKVVLMTVLAMAWFKPNEWEWKGEKFKTSKGQFITSLQSIADDCGKGITVQNVRTSLKRFEKLEFLTNESTKQGRLITIANWDLYQCDDNRLTKELTDDQQRANKELTTKEEGKKDNKEIINTFFDSIWKLYPSKKGKGNVSDAKKKELYKLGYETIVRCIDRYKAYVESIDYLQYKNGSTFFNSGYIDYLDENYVEAEKPQEKKSLFGDGGMYAD